MKINILLIVSVIAISCNQNKSSVDRTEIIGNSTKDSVPVEVVLDFHNDFDTVAQIISGKLALPNFNQKFYEGYSNAMNKDFDKILKDRLEPLSDWYATNKKRANRKTVEKVLYPFSGGDFLHVNTVYPEAKEYTLLAIEPVGRLPQIMDLDTSNKDSVLHQVKYMLRDVFLRSYFITKNMHLDIKDQRYIDGVLPMITWGIGISGYRILEVNSVAIDSNGQLVTSPADFENQVFKTGVQLKICKEGENAIKTVNYLSVDLSNNGLKKNEPLRRFLTQYSDVGSFMKAASYLCHYKGFSDIRNIVLKNSIIHLQDDTGIPYEYFNNSAYTSMLFGVYKKPIKDFSETLFQPDLVDAYNDSSKYFGSLPFSMGYHWASKFQNQMVFYKN